MPGFPIFGRILLGLLVIPALASRAQEPSATPDFLGEQAPATRLLLLGTFHFSDAGLDSYKPEFDVDILSDARQHELQQVLDLLEQFRPTKIAVERRPSRQAEIDSLYSAFRAGQFDLPSNEIYQLGFRLAARLGLDRVYAVDASARSFMADMTQEEWDVKLRELRRGTRPSPPWDARFTRLYRFDDSLKIQQSLRETLLRMNDPERIRQGHGHYMVGTLALGRGEDYFGADAATSWYNRNLRIFSNIMRITESPEDRILVIIGAGHLPFLRFAAEASPEYRLVEPAEYLAASPAGR
jgi:hypothetical protein